MEGLLCRFFKAHYQAQGYAEDVVLMQKKVHKTSVRLRVFVILDFLGLNLG
jgi:hypothetical protein